MSLPKINLSDGKHRMIVAEEGERVLTPEQNAEYERTHPDARKEPMKANIADCGGMVYDAGGGIPSMPQIGDQSLSKAPDMPLQTPNGPEGLGKIGGGQTSQINAQGDTGGKHVPIRSLVHTHDSSADPMPDVSHPQGSLGWAYDRGGDVLPSGVTAAGQGQPGYTGPLTDPKN